VSGAPIDARALAQAAVTALREGRHAEARRMFGQLAASGRADASVHLGLAYACLGTGDARAALAATERVLALEPGNLRALLLKADHLLRSGFKMEVESLITKDISYVTETYVPERLKARDWLE